MVLANRTPVSPRKQSLIIPVFAIHIMRENGNHIFIRIRIHVMDLVSLIEEIREHFGGRCIHNSG